MEDTEQRGPGIENGSEWANGTVHFDRAGPTEKRGPPRKVDWIFRNFSSWTEPIHSVLDRNFRKFWLNGSRPLCLAYFPHMSSSRFSRYNAPIYWLVLGHITSNNETVYRQISWTGNIAKTMTWNRKQITVTLEMLNWLLLQVIRARSRFLSVSSRLRLGKHWDFWKTKFTVPLGAVITFRLSTLHHIFSRLFIPPLRLNRTEFHDSSQSPLIQAYNLPVFYQFHLVSSGNSCNWG